jgi:DNA-binding winged helix-turn-helix (wHTH) protein
LSDQAVIRFGVFKLDQRVRELRKRGVKIKLQEQPYRILVLLLDSRGELVSRERLQQELWPGDTFVDFEHSLNAAVAKLRQALGETLVRVRYKSETPLDLAKLWLVLEQEAPPKPPPRKRRTR